MSIADIKASPGTPASTCAKCSLRRRCLVPLRHHVAACPRTPSRSFQAPPHCRRNPLPAAFLWGAHREVWTPVARGCVGTPVLCLPYCMAVGGTVGRFTSGRVQKSSLVPSPPPRLGRGLGMMLWSRRAQSCNSAATSNQVMIPLTYCILPSF